MRLLLLVLTYALVAVLAVWPVSGSGAAECPTNPYTPTNRDCALPACGECGPGGVMDMDCVNGNHPAVTGARGTYERTCRALNDAAQRDFDSACALETQGTITEAQRDALHAEIASNMAIDMASIERTYCGTMLAECCKVGGSAGGGG